MATTKAVLRNTSVVLQHDGTTDSAQEVKGVGHVLTIQAVGSAAGETATVEGSNFDKDGTWHLIQDFTFSGAGTQHETVTAAWRFIRVTGNAKVIVTMA